MVDDAGAISVTSVTSVTHLGEVRVVDDVGSLVEVEALDGRHLVAILRVDVQRLPCEGQY